MRRERRGGWSAIRTTSNERPKEVYIELCLSDSIIISSEVEEPCKSASSCPMSGTGRPALSLRPPTFPWFLNGGLPLQCTAYIRQPREYMSDAVIRTSSRTYSGAVDPWKWVRWHML